VTPDFLIVGAAKSGTTWLGQALHQNPANFLVPHEVHYFSRHFGDMSPQQYEALFAASRAEQRRGEKSNSYLTDPYAAQRIREALPGVRLVAILRCPIDRAYSGYCMRLRRGKASPDIGAYLDPAGPRSGELLANGLYHRQLSRYFDLFPRQQIHVALYEDIAARPGGLLAEVSDFIGSPFSPGDERLMQRVNARPEAELPPALRRAAGRLLGSEHLRRAVVAPLKRTGAWRAARAALAREVSYPPLDEAQRDRLRGFYAEDVARLSALTGRDLSHWLR
jgi:hypothetical protein